MPPKRISILGVGLLGGSIGLAAKAYIKGCQIIGYGHRQSSLDAALARGAVAEAYTDVRRAVDGCDLIILCTPVGLFNQLIPQIVPSLSPTALLTDVGSTKRSIVALAEKYLPNPACFVASHPIAGSEKRGVEFARADLFHNALCLTTPTPATDPAALQAVESFWQTLGMRVARLTPDDHDKVLADVSHLPHALAAAIMAIQSDSSLAFAGKGFLDLTRIAAGDPGLWRDIFLDNRDNLSAGLRRLESEIKTLMNLLDRNDAAGVQAWLDAAASRRLAMAPPDGNV